MKKTEVKRPKSTPGKTPSKPLSPLSRLLIVLKLPFIRMLHAVRNFQSRRPHRSFRLTRRRDYKRSLKLPGYWAFTLYVFQMLRRHWKLFLSLAVLYTIVSTALGTLTSVDVYQQVGDALKQGADSVVSGSISGVTQAGILAIAVFAGGGSQLTSVQQVFIVLAAVLSWLTTVWLLREIMVGRKPKLRDGLYNAGSPLISTIVVGAYLLLQSLPLGLFVLVFAALSSVGLATEGVPMLLLSAVGVVTVALTLYWMIATFFALIIITLPGMYPGRALRAAGDIVIGRRLRIALRLLWMVLIAAIVWFAIMIPLIMLETWLTDSFNWQWPSWLPFIPILASLLSTSTIIWIASYIYLLYRKVVDDDAAPAQ